MKELGWPTLSFEAYSQGLHQSLRQSLEKHLSPEALQKARQRYHILMQTLSTEVALRPSVFEGIGFLHHLGIRMGVVSNKEHASLQEEVYQSGLQPCFQAIVGSGYAAQDKPSPQPIWAALEALPWHQEAHPDVVWFIGDSRVDIEAATAAFCLPVFVGDTSFRTLHGLTQAFWHAGDPKDFFRHCQHLLANQCF